MSDLMTIARRFLAALTSCRAGHDGARPGEKGDKGEKDGSAGDFSPFTPFSLPVGWALPAVAGAEPWDQRAALRLMFDADALVGRLDIDGRHPDVQCAAAVVTSAHATRDMETLRFAVAEFTAAIRRVSAGRRQRRGGPASPNGGSSWHGGGSIGRRSRGRSSSVGGPA